MLSAISEKVQRLVSLVSDSGLEAELEKRATQRRAERRRELAAERQRLLAARGLRSDTLARVAEVEAELAGLAPAWLDPLLRLLVRLKGWELPAPRPAQTEVDPAALKLKLPDRAKPLDLAAELPVWRARHPLVDVAPIVAEVCTRKAWRFEFYSDEIADRLDAATRQAERNHRAARHEASGKLSDALRALRTLHLEAADDAELAQRARRLVLALPQLADNAAARAEVERLMSEA